MSSPGAAVITGAAGGIGSAVAHQAAEAGFNHLVLTDVDPEGLAASAVRFSGRNMKISTLVGDLTDHAVDVAVADAVTASGDPLSLLVNNAGVEHRAPFLQHTLEAWNRILEVNLTAVFRLTQHLTPLLQQARGAVVNVSSVAVTGFAGQAAYDASKGGLSTLTRSLAVELGRHEIRVNAVCPGFVDTPMLDDDGLREMAERHARTLPMRRIGTTTEMAAAIVWIGSSAASYITGQTLNVDGGWVRT